MVRVSSRVYETPTVGAAATPVEAGNPVCPECQSTLTRVPRRFLDRLVSLVYPVHRYHCGSFLCNWEGNLRYTPELSRWEASADSALSRRYRTDWRGARVEDPKTMPTDPLADVRLRLDGSDRARTTTPLESDTLPMPATPPFEPTKPHVRGESPDRNKPPRRAKKRAKADGR